jgi:methanogenic corrinoid protein MtbC1
MLELSLEHSEYIVNAASNESLNPDCSAVTDVRAELAVPLDPGSPVVPVDNDIKYAHCAELQAYAEEYLAALLKPDTQAAIRLTGAHVKTPEQIEVWWEQVIQPAMYTIGDLWAMGKISVGQEHLATAITQRVISVYYPLILNLPRPKGPIVITASPGEFHEIGPRIVADIFEVHGWDVYYTGANTPAATIVELLQSIEARFLCISTTLGASLPAVSALIAQVRAANLPSRPKILVGGQAYNEAPDLWRQVGADHFALSAYEGIAYIEAPLPAGLDSLQQPVSG